MAALLGSRRALSALAVLASSCSVYEPELVGAVAPQGGSAGEDGSQAGSGAAAGKQSAGNGGTGPSGGSAGSGGSTGGSGGSAGGEVVPMEPYLRGDLDTPDLTVVLSSEGTSDWMHWGLKGPADSNRKAGVTSQLDLTSFGADGQVANTGGPTAFSWNDGMPTVAATTHNSIAWEGAGQGFELVMPAVFEQRIARLYVGVRAGTAHLTAELSEAGTFVVDELIESDGDAWSRQQVILDYGWVDTPGATLTIAFNVETADSADASVSLSAISIDVK